MNYLSKIHRSLNYLREKQLKYLGANEKDDAKLKEFIDSNAVVIQRLFDFKLKVVDNKPNKLLNKSLFSIANLLD